MNPRSVEPLNAWSGVASADLGKAISLGPLSVPLNWSLAAPQIESVPPSSSATSLNASPQATIGSQPGRTFQQALMATVAAPGARPGITHAADHEESDEKDDGGNTEA